MLISSLIFFVLISSGTVFCAAFLNKKFEQTLSLSCAGIVLLLFLFGLLDMLFVGFVLVVALCIALWIVSFVRIAVNRDRVQRFRAFAKNFFTPVFFLFTLVFVYMLLLDKGRIAWRHDEFSHWADVVKAMTELDVLSTSPRIFVEFPSYPPGMSLFEYFFERIYLLINPGAEFCEALLYVAFYTFFISFFLPFFSNLDFRKIYPYILFATVILAPLTFYREAYMTLHIDQFLAVVSAAGYGKIVLGITKKKDFIDDLFVVACIAVLVLSKDVGMLFAAFLLTSYVSVKFFDSNDTAPRRQKILMSLGALAAFILPYLLWQLSIRLNGANVAFDSKIDVRLLIDAFLGRGDSFRSQYVDTFYNHIISERSQLYLFEVNLTYLTSFILVIAAAFVICRLFSERTPEGKRGYHLVFIVISLQLIVYVVGMLVAYLFKFKVWEAVSFACLERYVSSPSLCIFVFVILVSSELLRTSKRDAAISAVLLLCITLAMIPGTALKSLISRESIGEAREHRAVYDEICDNVNYHIENENQKIYLVSQTDGGGDYYVLKYTMRPHTVHSPLGWSLGPEELSQFSRECSPEDFQNLLLESYDYVAIINLDDYFVDTYGHLFESEEEIQKRSLFAVDKESGLLEFIGKI